MGEPPIIPFTKLPEAVALPPRMSLPVPSGPIPSYQPLVLPSAAQIRQMRASEDSAQQNQEEKSKAKPLPSKPLTPALPVDIQIPDEVPQEKEITTFTLPGTELEIPVPKAEVVTTAGVTAGVAALASVGATMAAGPMFQRIVKILKPVMKTALKKIAVARNLPPVESEAKLRWRQHARTRHSARYRV